MMNSGPIYVLLFFGVLPVAAVWQCVCTPKDGNHDCRILPPVADQVPNAGKKCTSEWTCNNMNCVEYNGTANQNDFTQLVVNSHFDTAVMADQVTDIRVYVDCLDPNLALKLSCVFEMTTTTSASTQSPAPRQVEMPKSNKEDQEKNRTILRCILTGGGIVFIVCIAKCMMKTEKKKKKKNQNQDAEAGNLPPQGQDGDNAGIPLQEHQEEGPLP